MFIYALREALLKKVIDSDEGGASHATVFKIVNKNIQFMNSKVSNGKSFHTKDFGQLNNRYFVHFSITDMTNLIEKLKNKTRTSTLVGLQKFGE